MVTSDLVARDRSDLLIEIEELQRRVALLGSVVCLLTAMLRVSKVRLDFERLPDGKDKRVLLRAIERSKKAIPLLAGRWCMNRRLEAIKGPDPGHMGDRWATILA